MNWMFKPDENDPEDRSKARLWTDRDYVNALYDAEIAYMDDTMGQLWAYLDETGLTDNTLLVVTADHGEELDEHKLWYDHHGMYETNIWVPLISNILALSQAKPVWTGL